MITVMNAWRGWAAGVALGGCVALGCGGAAPPATNTEPATAADAPAPPELTNISQLFPPGPGRQEVLDNCASCHSVACTTIGQRSNAHWDSLRGGHADRAPGPELDLIFTYLKANFNDAKPEPQVPPEFLEGGCTPPG